MGSAAQFRSCSRRHAAGERGGRAAGCRLPPCVSPRPGIRHRLGHGQPLWHHTGGRTWCWPGPVPALGSSLGPAAPIAALFSGTSGQTWRHVFPPLPRAPFLLQPATLWRPPGMGGTLCACSRAVGAMDHPAPSGGNACDGAAARTRAACAHRHAGTLHPVASMAASLVVMQGLPGGSQPRRRRKGHERWAGGPAASASRGVGRPARALDKLR